MDAEPLKKALTDIASMADIAAALIYSRMPNKLKPSYAAKAQFKHNIRLRNLALKALKRDNEATSMHSQYDPMEV